MVPTMGPGDQRMPLTLYTFGDSILDAGWYNDLGLNPGQLLIRNDDQLFPEFQGQDLSSHGPAQLDQPGGERRNCRLAPRASSQRDADRESCRDPDGRRQ